MAVKVIVELRAAPGRRDELKSVLHTLLADLGPGLKEKGSLGSTFYEVVDDPDALVEIADWETADARDAVMSDPSDRRRDGAGARAVGRAVQGDSRPARLTSAVCRVDMTRQHSYALRSPTP